MMAHYQLGNCLRGYIGGDFQSDHEAWQTLSERFNEMYPSYAGREVQLMKTIRDGTTKGGNETEQARITRETLADRLSKREA